MTDRASAEGLRRYRAIINANGAMEFIEDPDGPLVTYADVAALRDTGSRPPSDDGGPRPDSGMSRSVIRRQNVMAGREMNKGIAGPRPDGEGPWRDDQGYWLGGMGTPDTGPRPVSGIDEDVLRQMVERPMTSAYFEDFNAGRLDSEQVARALAGDYAALSTPRTETSDDA